VRIDDAHVVITGRRFPQHDENRQIESSRIVGVTGTTICVLGSAWLLHSKERNKSTSTRGILTLVGKVTLVAVTSKILLREWGNHWMTTKIKKSTADSEEWQKQWLLIATTRRGSITSLDVKSQRLIEYAMSQSPKVCIVFYVLYKCDYDVLPSK
jgi:hypothetical protein